MSQLPLNFAVSPDLSAENFHLSASNEHAHALVMSWPDWPAHALVLAGEAGTGKSHLAALWRAQSGAALLEARELSEFTPQEGGILIENIERAASERALFHWFNHTREHGQSLLMTSAVPPSQLPFSLPDLMSRLRSLPVAQLESPDDALLTAILAKQFADRQIMVEDGLIAYLLPRVERSAAALAALVARLDEHSLAQKRKLSIPFVRTLLEA